MGGGGGEESLTETTAKGSSYIDPEGRLFSPPLRLYLTDHLPLLRLGPRLSRIYLTLTKFPKGSIGIKHLLKDPAQETSNCTERPP